MLEYTDELSITIMEYLKYLSTTKTQIPEQVSHESLSKLAQVFLEVELLVENYVWEMCDRLQYVVSLGQLSEKL